LEIDIKELLRSVQALQTPRTRIGCPDDPTPVGIADLRSFVTCLDNALRAFRDLRGGADYLVSAEVNAYHRCVGVRFVQRGECGKAWEDRIGQVEPALEAVFLDLYAAAARNDGVFSYWGGTNFLDLSFPFKGPVREEFPEVKHLPWDERYRYLLERATWGSLRHMVFRFSNLAESFATRCVELGLSRALIPSVGLCVHPWLFAEHGLSVVATDAAGSALTALSEPHRWPRLYSQAAFERWDIAESAHYATQGNPDHFARMPDLEDRGVRESLRQRITFALSAWADLPLRSGSVDAIFATNALPRESSAEQLRVLEEWARVVRPGGIVFIAQHNFFDAGVEAVLRDSGWVEANILGGERPAQSGVTGFQIRYSSG
jgi:hypothetical protein